MSRCRFEPVGQGRRARVTDYHGFRVVESLHRAGAAIDRHAHEHGCLTLLLGGHMQERFGSQTVECGQGSVLIKPPEERHSTRFGPKGAHCFIIECLQEPTGETRRGGALFAGVSHGVVDAALTRLLTAELTREDGAADTILEGIALQLIGQWSRARSCRVSSSRRPPPWLADVYDRIQASFRSRLTVSGLAESAGVHPDSLGRAFRRHYGRSIGDLLRDLRLSWAAEQLARTDRRLSSIAQDAGFYDQSHFSVAFRRRFGVTPSRYRGDA